MSVGHPYCVVPAGMYVVDVWLAPSSIVARITIITIGHFLCLRICTLFGQHLIRRHHARI